MEAKTLALYLGCQVRFMQNDKLTLVGIDEDSELPVICLLEGKHRRVFSIDEIKLLLRPLSSMTEEEAEEIWYMAEPKHVLTTTRTGNITVQVALSSERTRWLLSKGFDLFGLIESGDAINSNKGGH